MALTRRPVAAGFLDDLPNAKKKDPQKPAELPMPNPLGAADANDAGALTAALGEYTARCMYSRNWQHRNAALNYMALQVATKLSSLHGPNNLLFV